MTWIVLISWVVGPIMNTVDYNPKVDTKEQCEIAGNHLANRIKNTGVEYIAWKCVEEKAT